MLDLVQRSNLSRQPSPYQIANVFPLQEEEAEEKTIENGFDRFSHKQPSKFSLNLNVASSIVDATGRSGDPTDEPLIRSKLVYELLIRSSLVCPIICVTWAMVAVRLKERLLYPYLEVRKTFQTSYLPNAFLSPPSIRLRYIVLN